MASVVTSASRYAIELFANSPDYIDEVDRLSLLPIVSTFLTLRCYDPDAWIERLNSRCPLKKVVRKFYGYTAGK